MLILIARPIAAALAVAGLAGCASGPIAGRLALPGREPEPATLRYEASLFGKTGKLSALLPSGERFAGTYVLTPQRPEMISVLSGDRGGALVCHFKLNEPGVGPDSGGSVQCRLSTGGTFDATF